MAQQFSRWIRRADIAETTRATGNTPGGRTSKNAGVTMQVDVRSIRRTVKAWVADLADAGNGVPTIENALGVSPDGAGGRDFR